MRVQRTDDSGRPLGPGQPEMSVQLSSDAPAGAFQRSSEAPQGTWRTTLDLVIPASSAASEPFRYRDPSAGTTTIRAAASGYAPAAASLSVSPHSFTADFETGSLLTSDTPPGPFNDEWLPAPLNTLGAIKNAAHRGAYGMRLTDQEQPTEESGQNNVSWRGAPLSRAFLRFWFRIARSNDTGFVVVAEFVTPNSRGMNAILLQYPGPKLVQHGADATGKFVDDETDVSLELGRWYLLELGVEGAGTRNGRRVVFVDGRPVARREGLDFSSDVIDRFNIGQPWSDGVFTGELDFDDVRSATEPMVSRFDIAPLAGTVAGRCTALEVRLVDASGQPRPSPYSFAAHLEVSGVQTPVYGDASCEVPLTEGIPLAAQAASAAVFLRPQAAGSGMLKLSYPDFVAASVALRAEQGPRAVIDPETLAAAAGTRIELSGERSRPSAGATLTAYRWALKRGPTGVRFAQAGRQALDLNVPGEYEVELAVEDSSGAVSPPARALLRMEGRIGSPPKSLGGCAYLQSPAGEDVSLFLALLLLPLVGLVPRRRR